MSGNCVFGNFVFASKVAIPFALPKMLGNCVCGNFAFASKVAIPFALPKWEFSESIKDFILSLTLFKLYEIRPKK